MENIGDWLYMVIIIIAALSSIIGSINKKAKQTTTENQPSREVVTQQDLEGADPWIGTTEKPQPVFRPQRQTQSVANPDYRPSEYKKRTKTGNYSSFFKQESPSASFLIPEEDRPTVSLEDMPTHTDEWRKAFIYHEVFNRKY